jgi:hypothetical protein
MSQQNVWYYTVEYYSDIKSSEILIHATPWLNLKNIMLNEKKPDRKGHITYDPIYRKCPK